MFYTSVTKGLVKRNPLRKIRKSRLSEPGGLLSHSEVTLQLKCFRIIILIHTFFFLHSLPILLLYDVV